MLSKTSLRAVARLALVLSLAGAASAGNVLVVQWPTGYTTIQAAVDAASDGDVILVKGDNYASFYVDDKSLDIVAETGALVTIDGAVRIANLSAGKRVLLSGLVVHGIGAPVAWYLGNGLTLADCAGSVRVQDCTLVGADNATNPDNCAGWNDESGWEGAQVSNCADVAFAGCTLTGGRGLQQKDALGCYKYTPGGEGGHALLASAATVALHDCVLNAGKGGRGGWGGNGGDGGRINNGSLAFASGSTLRGGDGGYGFDWLWGPGGDGGAGLGLSGDSQATLLDADLFGGVGGPSALFADGQPGLPFAGPAPLVHPGQARIFSSPVPVRESTQVQLAFDGEPFDFGLVVVGAIDAHLPLPPFQGVLLAGAPSVVALGSLGATGTQTFNAPLGPLPPGVQAASAVLQGVVVNSSAEIVLAGSRVQVILDASL